jgi:shikimate 5-dehydrogenase
MPFYAFNGNEAVIDVIYKPAETAFLRRARASGCRVRNGDDMLYRQGVAQFSVFFGAPPLSEP